MKICHFLLCACLLLIPCVFLRFLERAKTLADSESWCPKVAREAFSSLLFWPEKQNVEVFSFPLSVSVLWFFFFLKEEKERRKKWKLYPVHFGNSALSQQRIFSYTLRHKWTHLIDFLSSHIALIAVNMEDKSIWLCVYWESMGRQRGSSDWACHGRGASFITPNKSPLLYTTPTQLPQHILHPLLTPKLNWELFNYLSIPCTHRGSISVNTF